MNNIYQSTTFAQVLSRIDNLKPDTQRKWGKMDVAQMMAHCSAVLEIALGDKKGTSSFFAKLMGPMFKGMMTNEKPFKRDLPTDQNFLIVDPKNFEAEKQRLKILVERMSKGGEAAMENKRHPFFGKLTAMEWGTSNYKHLEHHLLQFGV